MGNHLPSVLMEHLSEQLTYLVKTTVFLKNFFSPSNFISLTKTSNIPHDIIVIIPVSSHLQYIPLQIHKRSDYASGYN